jgi:hypothetical protein
MLGVKKSSLMLPLMRSPVVAPIGTVRTLIVVPYSSPRKKTLFSARQRTRKLGAPYRKPTLEVASAMPLAPQEMDNALLVALGTLGHHDARREILKRHIMSVDRVSYDDSELVYQKIAAKNKEGMFLLALPYQIGLGAAITTGFASLPMVFHLGTAEWFNRTFVTTQVPEPEDLETLMEVGSWAWSWMEPPRKSSSL